MIKYCNVYYKINYIYQLRLSQHLHDTFPLLNKTPTSALSNDTIHIFVTIHLILLMHDHYELTARGKLKMLVINCIS